MDRLVNKAKPQRPFDEEAKRVFLGVMERLKAEQTGQDKCWIWPEEWPPSWGDVAEGYSISREGKIYGQFVMAGTATHRQMTLKATRLAYKHFNEKRDPRWVAHDQFSPDSEWLGGDFDSKTFVRHDDEKCTSRACVNPNHLRLGPGSLNALDRELKKNKDTPIPPEALARTEDIMASFGHYSAHEMAEKFNMKAWQVVRIAMKEGLPWDALLDPLPWPLPRDVAQRVDEVFAAYQRAAEQGEVTAKKLAADLNIDPILVLRIIKQRKLPCAELAEQVKPTNR